MRQNHAIRAAAEAAGLRHFIARCPKHGEQRHYTSSGRCMQCAAQAKDPETQARYWATVGEAINAKRRVEYAARRGS